MNKKSSALRHGIAGAIVCILSVVFILMAAPGTQRVLAQPETPSFIGNSFNITPGYISSDQMSPGIAYNNNLDQWLVLWQDDRNGNFGISGRRVDKNGSLLAEITVMYNTDTLTRPAAAYDSTQHRYLVVWVNTTDGNIAGRVLNADGTAYTVNAFLIANCTDCKNPDVVYNPIADAYLVVWEETNSVSDKDVHGRFVGVEGDVDPGGAFPIADETDIIDQTPAVVVNPSTGTYLVVYSRNTSGNFSIGGQRLYMNGSLYGSVLSISSDGGDELNPDVALNPRDGWAFVAWQHDTGETEVDGRILRADNSLGGQPLLSTSGGSDEQQVSISYAAVGDPYLVTWDNGADVLGRWVSVVGAVASDIFIVTSTNTQYSPAVAFGSDRFLVTYSDWSGQYDVYGRLGAPNPRLFLPLIRK